MRRIICILLLLFVIASTFGCSAAPVAEKEADARYTTIGSPNHLTALNTDEEIDMKPAEICTKTVAVADAFIQGGTYASQNMDEAKRSSGYLTLREAAGGTYHREVLVRFSLSELDLMNKNTIYLRLDFVDGGTNPEGKPVWFAAYGIPNAWDPTTVTYNSAPSIAGSKPTGRALGIKSGVTQIDVTDYVLDAFDKGEKEVSFRVVIETETRSQASAFSTATTEEKREKPTLMAFKTGKQYVDDILADKEQNKALWDYAQKLYDEWFARYEEIKAKGDYDAEMIQSNPADFSKTVQVKTSPKSAASPMPTRIVSTINGYEAKEYETDPYGGIISEKMKFEATGRFYTKEVDGRWWLITPLGNPCIIRGLNQMHYAYQGKSPYQTAAMERVYGSAQKWAIAATRWVMAELGFNVGAGTADEIWQVENGLSATVRNGYSGMATYAQKQNVVYKSSPFVMRYNDAMPVFDPAFATYIDSVAKETVEIYKDRLPHVLGYTSDNELPVADDMLIGFLTLDPSIPENVYSYAVAWTWYKNITGEPNPPVSKAVTATYEGENLLDLFKGFVYDRYYGVFATAYEKYDPDGLFLGVRTYISCNYWEWLARVTGYWCDAMCINYYHAWQIDEQNLYDLERWSGCPLFITEFYAKGEDAIAADGKPFANTNGAGFVVPTQADRGYFYQNFTLRLLENKNCIGWLFFQYIDNNPLDADIHPAAHDSNKGIITSDHDTEAYKALTDQMAELNKNVYSLIEFFDGESYFE